MHKGFVLLNCDLGAEEYILEELQQVSEIKNAYVTFGAYDIVAEIDAETQEEWIDARMVVSDKLDNIDLEIATTTQDVMAEIAN